MSVGKKVISTQLLDISVNKNFESVKDGVGKPLSMAASDAILGDDIKSFDVKLESFINALGNGLASVGNIVGNIASGVKGAIEGIIGGISNVVGNFVSQVLQAAGKAFTAIGSAIKRIITALQLDKVLDMAKSAVKAITDVLRIPMQFIGSIFNKAKTFIKSMLSTLGSTLKDKLGLSKIIDAGKGVFKFIASISNIFTTGIVAAIFGTIRHSKETLSSITDKLLDEVGFNRVANAYRYLFNKDKNLPRHYYSVYDNLGRNKYKNDPVGLSIFNSRYSNNNYKNNRLLNTPIRNKKELFDIFLDLGYDKGNSQDLAKLAKNNTISPYLPISTQYSSINKSYNDLITSVDNRTEFSTIETLNAIRNTSGMIKPEESKLDNSDKAFEDYSFRKKGYQLALIRYTQIDYGRRFERYVYEGNPRDINKPLTFIKPDTKDTVTADFTKKTESEQLSSMVGIVSARPKNTVGISEFQGYSKNTAIPNKKPNTPKPIHELEDVIFT